VPHVVCESDSFSKVSVDVEALVEKS
jgi:hypothetical protein